MARRVSRDLRARRGQQAPGSRPRSPERTGDQQFATELAEQNRERKRRAELASRVNAAELEASVAERSGARPSAVPESSNGRNLPVTTKQLGLLRALASETETTFTYPRTRGEAMDEIARMKALRPGRRTRKRGRKRSQRRRAPSVIH